MRNRKTRKQVLCLAGLSGPVNFYQFIAKETFSGTRIDQNKAVPVFTTIKKISHQESSLADKVNLSH